MDEECAGIRSPHILAQLIALVVVLAGYHRILSILLCIRVRVYPK